MDLTSHSEIGCILYTLLREKTLQGSREVKRKIQTTNNDNPKDKWIQNKSFH